MKVLEEYKPSLEIGRNTAIINDEIYKKLLENSFSFLTERKEIHATNSLYNSKPDVVKEFYAALLAVTAEFARKNMTTEDIVQYLNNDCGFTSERSNLFSNIFEKERIKLEITLFNIGNALPHVTDVKWKIDYILKSSEMDCSGGPLFRICLVTEQYNDQTENKELKNIHFTCNSMELMDLIYKLKDALRHCNNLTQRVF